MKKIISIAIALIVVVFLVSINVTKAIGIIEDSGYALLGDEIVKYLSSDEVKQDEMTVKTFEVSHSDSIYERNGEILIGEDRQKINKQFPIFTHSGRAINLITNNGSLITDNFSVYEAFPNIFLTDGKLYQSGTRERLDNNNYILYKTSDDIYVSLNNVKVKTFVNEYNLPMNSIVKFNENSIKAYTLVNNVFSYRSINDVDKNTMLYMNDNIYTYEEFLKNLKKVSEENKSNGKNEEENNEKKDSENKNNTNKNDLNNSEENKNEAGNNLGNGVGNIAGNIVGNTSGSENIEGGNNDSSNKEVVEGYIEPKVLLLALNAGVYSIEPKVNIDDPSARITYPIEVKIFEGSKLILRKNIESSDLSAISGLKPSTKYRLDISYSYVNEYGEKSKREAASEEFTTKDISELSPVEFSFNEGELYSDSVELNNFKAIFKDDESRKNSTAIQINYGSTITNISEDDINLLKSENEIKVKSQQMFNSNETYNFEIVVLDKYGNKLPVSNANGVARTSMKAPKGTISIEKQNGLAYSLAYKEENKDNVDILNKKYVLYDIKDEEVLQGQISQDNKIELVDLNTETMYFVRVIGDYDLKDNKGLKENMIISEFRLTTVPMAALGSISIKNEFVDVTKDSFKLNFSVDQDSTRDILIKLLDKFKISISDENNNIIYSKELNDEELNLFKNNKELSFSIENLQSKSFYNLKVETFNIDNTGSEKEIKNLLYSQGVRTLKRPAQVYITNIYTTETSMKSDTYIEDLDGVIDNGKVIVEIRSNVNNKLIFSDTLEVNKLYKDIEIKNLTPGESYSLKAIAEQYNEGYDKSTLKTNYVIKDATVIAENTVDSSLTLKKLSENNDGSYTAKIKVYITNWYKLFPNNEFMISYYKDGTLDKTFTYEVDMSTMVFDKEIEYILEKGHEYEFKIYANVYGNETVFTNIKFRTDKELIGIYSASDFKEIENDLTADYLVLKDLDLTKESVTIEGNFTGEVNFDGHKAKIEVTEKNNALFRNIEKGGIIKNAVIDIVSYKSDFNGKYGLSENNNGTISNVYVNFEGSNYGINENMSLLSKNNYGTIEKFVINVNKSVYTANNMGLVSINNYGIVKNGYIYGEKIAASAGNAAGRIVGGAVATNYENGTVEYVQSHTSISGPTINQSENIGNIVGKNIGNVKSLYSVGVGANILDGYGPTVGSSSGNSDNIYYYGGDANTNSNVNEKVRASRLRTIKFMKSIFNVENFDVSEEVVEFYPKLKLDESMPKQPDLELEKDNSLSEVSIIDKSIENVTDNSATINITINNPKKVSFIGVRIPGLHTRIIDTSTVGESTDITLEATAEKYYSNYYIADISYMDTGSGGKITFQPNEEVIRVAFYKSIKTIQDWQSIDRDSGENYTLENSIDLSSISNTSLVNNIKVGSFRGNGNKISGITLNYTAASRGLFSEVTGTFSNVNFEGIRITSNNNSTGIFVTNKGTLENLTFKDIDIKIEGINRLNAGPIVNNEGVVRNISITETRVKGNSFISGLVVNNVNNNSVVSNIVATDIKIEGENTSGSKKHHAVAVAYVSAGTVQNVTVKNSEVIAGTKSGIAIAEAASGDIRDIYVVDSKLSTINLNGLNQVGGIIGILLDDVKVTNAGIVNSEVYGKEYVGGAFSNAGGATFKNIFVIDVKVEAVAGHRAAGIIATTGGNKYFSLDNAYSMNVSVKGNDFVGGIIGYMNNGDITNAYTNANVVGNAKVGGVAGSIDSGRDMKLENIMSFATIVGSDPKTTSYGGGAVQFSKNNIKNLYIWEESKSNSVAFKDSSKLNYEAKGFRSSELFDNKFFSEKLGFSNENWNIDTLVSGFMPKITYEGKPLKYQNDIQIPGITSYSLRSGEREFIEAPKVKLYSIGADTINLEFSNINDALDFEISSNDVSMVKSPLDKEIYTLQYDYNSMLRVDIKHDDEVISTYSISPLDINRNVSVNNNKYYYVINNGVKTNDSFIEGSFVNINAKEGLRTDGTVVDLDSKKVIRENVVGVKLLDKIEPLFNFKYQGSNIDIYNDYALIDGVKKEILLYVKNNIAHPLDSKFSFVRDSLIIDTIEGKEYETVLGSDGVLYDLKTKLNYPNGFVNKGIKYISNNIYDNSNNIIVYYEDGSITGFNYKTGKLIFEEANDSPSNEVTDISLVDYIKEKGASIFRFAENMFNGDLDNESSELSKSYKESLEVKDAIKEITKSEQGNNQGASENSLTIMYNKANNRHEVYSLSDIVSKEKEEVISENTKIENANGDSKLKLQLLKNEKVSKRFKLDINSILLFGAIVILIYGTMAYVFRKYINR